MKKNKKLKPGDSVKYLGEKQEEVEGIDIVHLNPGEICKIVYQYEEEDGEIGYIVVSPRLHYWPCEDKEVEFLYRVDEE